MTTRTGPTLMADHQMYKLEDWRKLAGIRQGIINKLESRIRKLEAENAELRAVKA